MKAVTGIFDSAEDAKRAVERLCQLEVDPRRVNVITPGTSAVEIEGRVPTDDTEGPGIATAIGGVLGGTAGLLAASIFIPGIGPFAAIGVTAATVLLGLGSAAGGAAIGHAIENAATTGIPHDELFLYEDAVRRGKSLVIVIPADAAEADRVREGLRVSGADSIDAARQDWWVGIRDAEKVHYERTHGRDFGPAEERYRLGYEAALATGGRGRDVGDVEGELAARYGAAATTDEFRRGFARGRDQLRTVRARSPRDPSRA